MPRHVDEEDRDRAARHGDEENRDRAAGYFACQAAAGGPGHDAKAVEMEWTRDEYRITTDPARVDVDALHAFLTRSYWATGIPRERVARSIEHSLNFSLWHEPAG